MNADWPGYLGLFLEGAWTTVELTVSGCLLALVVAFVVGIARLAPSPLLRGAAIAYVEFFRGTSIFVQLFWMFYVLPLLGVRLSPIWAGIVALGLNSGAYAAEVVRAATLAVPREQTEASIALNLTRWQRFRWIILPQAFVIMLPTLNNNAIELLKGSATVSLITITDLTFQAQIVRSATGNTAIPFLTVLGLYYLIASAITLAIRRIERRASRGLDIVRA